MHIYYTPSCQVADDCNISSAHFIQEDKTKWNYCTLLTYIVFSHCGKTWVAIAILILLNSAFNLCPLFGN